MTSLSETSMLAGSSGVSTGFAINQSIRFNSGDSAYMHRTPSSTGNRKTFTSSFWFKRGKLGTDMYLGGPNVSNSGYAYGIYFASDDSIYVWIYYSGSAWQGQLYTNRLFRDPSAWYHIVLSVDTTQAVSSERVRIYVNGQRETSFATENYPNQNQDTSWNVSGTQMSIGSGDTNPSASGAFFDGYLAEIHFLDGYAYGPEYFGEFKEDTDIWIPKEYEGSYGTNGFKIDGRDASDLGDDESGNGNDFTTSGLAAHDQVKDSPTNNFATINVLDFVIRNAAGSVPLSEGNLKFTGSNSTSVYGTYNCTVPIPDSGSWYFEMLATSIGSQEKQSQYIYVGNIGFLSNGNLNGGGSYGSAWSDGDIIGVAVNSSGIWFSINGTYQNSGNPATGSNSAGTPSLPGMILTGDGSATNNSSLTGVLNFGQDSTFAGATSAGGNSDASGIGNFKYSVPSGFKALCTKNLGS